MSDEKESGGGGRKPAPMLGGAGGVGKTFPMGRAPPKLQKTGSLKSNAINQMISMNQGEEKEVDRKSFAFTHFCSEPSSFHICID